MPYYKILAPFGHHGSGYYNHKGGWVFGRGKDLLDACSRVAKTPGLTHSGFVPYRTYLINEREFVINSMIVCQRKHYDNDIVFKQIHQMGAVVNAIIAEHKITQQEICYEAKNLLSYHNSYEQAKIENNLEKEQTIKKSYYRWAKKIYYKFEEETEEELEQ